MAGSDTDTKKLISITLDEGSIGRGGPEQEHERAIAIYDLIEANRLAAEGVIQPAVMVTHVGGLDAVADTTLNLPHIPGGKKLIYTQLDMPLTAIEDFGKLGEKDPFFLELDRCCREHNGLWNGQAEKMLLEHFQVEI